MLDMSVMSPVATFLIEHLDLPEATGIPDAKWETFQLKYLNNLSTFSAMNKTRQCGFSFLTAAESVGYGCLENRATSIFISINQDEAAEKIRYAKACIEALDRSSKPRLLIDNALGLEFDNGSRLISHPSRPPRGKARARIYLDELAHYAKDREIYAAAIPVTTRGGVIRIGSSPLGASGMFWEIYSQSLQAYPGYKRFKVPWWSIRALCTDVHKASLIARTMTTDERVYAFGSPRLISIYENMIAEDFQQEYECAWVDESVAWIDWNLIKRNQELAQDGNLYYLTAKTVEGAFSVIDDLAIAIKEGKVEGALVGGNDIGRKHDLSEIILLGKATTNQLPYRLGISLDRVEFDTQEAVANRILERLPITQYLIDQNGIGMPLAEKLQRRWGVKVHPAEFTNPNKELWAVETKLRFQRAEIPIPADRDLVYQIHSMKRKVTAAKNSVFDCDASEKHHADKFWALALAIWAGKAYTGGAESIAALERRMEEEKKRNEAGSPLGRNQAFGRKR